MQIVTKRLVLYLKNLVNKNHYVDVGVGEEKACLASRERFMTALREIEKDEKYKIYCCGFETNGKKATIKVLGMSDSPIEEVFNKAKEFYDERLKKTVE